MDQLCKEHRPKGLVKDQIRAQWCLRTIGVEEMQLLGRE